MTVKTAPKSTAKPARLLALVEADAPAKVKREVPWKNEPAVVRARQALVTRQPDIFDEVTGEALWFGEGFAIVVKLERLDDFKAYVASRGMAPRGATAYDCEFASPTVNVGWDRVIETVRSA